MIRIEHAAGLIRPAPLQKHEKDRVQGQSRVRHRRGRAADRKVPIQEWFVVKFAEILSTSEMPGNSTPA